jgi:phage shock protein E
MSYTYDCSFIKQQLNEGGQLIDVRSPIEFSHGALKSAINMPIDRFQLLMNQIDNTKPILLYCRTGARSEMVKNYLERLGYGQVHNIGGLNRFARC